MSPTRTKNNQVTVSQAAGCGVNDDFRAGSAEENPVRYALHRLLLQMGLDVARAYEPDWNPLGRILAPGNRVVVKPNLVYHKHYKGGSLHWVITDPRLIEAVCELVFRAIGPDGEVVLGDAPLQSADWEVLVRESGLAGLPARFRERGYQLSLVDFRTMATINVAGLKCNPKALSGDVHGYRAVDFGAKSMHEGRDWRRYRVTNYDPVEMSRHHNKETHEYLISGSVLRAHAVINLPKLKTHRKSGLTCALKNMVGINGCKDWLPHHAAGGTENGGDEYAGSNDWKRLTSWIAEKEERSGTLPEKVGWNLTRKLCWKVGVSLTQDSSWEGSWHGNDTLWRTIVDLNRAALYADADGRLSGHPQRTVLTIADALLAGEGEGPMAPTPVPLGCLLGGLSPLAVDMAACQLARWPARILKTIDGAFAPMPHSLALFDRDRLDVVCFSDSGAEAPIVALSHFLTPSDGFRVAAHADTLACSVAP